MLKIEFVTVLLIRGKSVVNSIYDICDRISYTPWIFTDFFRREIHSPTISPNRFVIKLLFNILVLERARVLNTICWRYLQTCYYKYIYDCYLRILTDTHAHKVKSRNANAEATTSEVQILQVCRRWTGSELECEPSSYSDLCN